MTAAQAVRDKELRRQETEHLIDCSGVIEEMLHQAEEEDARSRKHHKTNRPKHEGHSVLKQIKRKATSHNRRNVAGRPTHKKARK